MTNEEWIKAEQYNYNLLDRIDLTPYLHKWSSIYDIIDEIEEDAFQGVFEADVRAMLDDPMMKGEIFNYIGSMEFIDYLTEKYGVVFHERIDYYIADIKNDINK